MAAFESGTATTAEDDKMADYTQEQFDAAVAAAKAEGETAAATAKSEGVTAERNRRSTIMQSEEAKDRPKAAAAMVEKGLDADMAVSLLAELPKENAAPAPAPKPKATGTPFDDHMQHEGTPDVGAEGGSGGEELDDDAKATASIVGAAKVFRGTAAA